MKKNIRNEFFKEHPNYIKSQKEWNRARKEFYKELGIGEKQVLCSLYRLHELSMFMYEVIEEVLDDMESLQQWKNHYKAENYKLEKKLLKNIIKLKK